MSESIRLSLDIKLRERSIIAAIILLILPATFYWSGLDYGSSALDLYAINDAFAYSAQSVTMVYATTSYLALLTAFLVRKRSEIRSFMIVLGGILQLMYITQFVLAIVQVKDYSFIKMLQIVFVYTDGFFPLQLMATLALVPLLYLVRQNINWVIAEAVKFVGNLKESGKSTKSKFAYAASILLVLFVLISLYSNIRAFLDLNKTFVRGFHPELLLAALGYVVDLVLVVALISIISLYIFNNFDRASNQIRELNSVLRDFKLSTYVTRQISGYLYWFYYIVIVGIFAIVGPVQTFTVFEDSRQSLDSGFHPELGLILIAGPLITLVIAYLTILILRLIFELIIALVHIAQNTANSRNQN